MNEPLVDRPPVLGLEFGKFLFTLGKRRRALAGPHHGVEREPGDELRMLLRE
jgi:hypothetical protein